jgi:uncharacterized membrane protein
MKRGSARWRRLGAGKFLAVLLAANSSGAQVSVNTRTDPPQVPRLPAINLIQSGPASASLAKSKLALHDCIMRKIESNLQNPNILNWPTLEIEHVVSLSCLIKLREYLKRLDLELSAKSGRSSDLATDTTVEASWRAVVAVRIDAAKAGHSAAALTLPDIRGTTVEVAQFRQMLAARKSLALEAVAACILTEVSLLSSVSNEKSSDIALVVMRSCSQPLEALAGANCNLVGQNRCFHSQVQMRELNQEGYDRWLGLVQKEIILQRAARQASAGKSNGSVTQPPDAAGDAITTDDAYPVLDQLSKTESGKDIVRKLSLCALQSLKGSVSKSDLRQRMQSAVEECSLHVQSLSRLLPEFKLSEHRAVHLAVAVAAKLAELILDNGYDRRY